MTTIHHRVSQFRRQRGAVLYVAMIMMVLLALLGVVGMRVAGLQERMSANYRDVNQAFQAAELGAREIELEIRDTLSSGAAFTADSENCADRYDPAAWAEAGGTDQVSANHTQRIDKCFPYSSLTVGHKESEHTANIYQVTALRSNGNGNSSAVIDTVFVP